MAMIENANQLREFNRGVLLNDSSYMDLLNTLYYTVDENKAIDNGIRNKVKLKIVKLQQMLEEYSA